MVRGLYQLRQAPPFVAGSECAGVITEVGAEVTGLAVGDRVLALVGSGGFASDVVVRPSTQQVHRIPDEMPFDEAAAFEAGSGPDEGDEVGWRRRSRAYGARSV